MPDTLEQKMKRVSTMNRTVKQIDGETVFCFHIMCRQCGKMQEIMVDKETDARIMDWYKGTTYIQDACPSLSAAERELFISQTCGDCWDRMFGGDEEDEYEEEF